MHQFGKNALKFVVADEKPNKKRKMFLCFHFYQPPISKLQ